MITTILARIIIEQDVPEISMTTIRDLIDSGNYELSMEQFEINGSTGTPQQQTFLLTEKDVPALSTQNVEKEENEVKNTLQDTTENQAK